MDFLQQLQWRSATRDFDAKRRIPRKDLRVLLESLRMTPSAYDLQPWKFVRVKDKGVRSQLRQHSHDQPQVTEASEFLVLCARTSLTPRDINHYVRVASQIQHLAESSYTKYKGMIVKDAARLSVREQADWNARQVYIALGFLLATAAYMKIDACPIEGFNPKKFEKILALKRHNVVPVVCVALGYRRAKKQGEKTRKKVRFAAKEVFLER